MCGSYNRWLADVWKQSKGRLRWMATLPLLSMPDALDQLKFAQENGGCGVSLRPLEGSRQISDPYFFPCTSKRRRSTLALGCIRPTAALRAVEMMVWIARGSGQSAEKLLSQADQKDSEARRLHSRQSTIEHRGSMIAIFYPLSMSLFE